MSSSQDDTDAYSPIRRFIFASAVRTIGQNRLHLMADYHHTYRTQQDDGPKVQMLLAEIKNYPRGLLG